MCIIKRSWINYCTKLFMFLQAFDQHLNMVLGDVEESVITREVDEETDEEIVRVRPKLVDSACKLLFIFKIFVCFIYGCNFFFVDIETKYRDAFCTRRCGYSCVPSTENCLNI